MIQIAEFDNRFNRLCHTSKYHGTESGFQIGSILIISKFQAEE